MTGIHIFTRDLRIYDNNSLNKLSELVETIIPIFIINEYQVTDYNKYKSNNGIQFMYESLKDLNEEINLVCFKGTHEEVIESILNNNKTIKYVSITYDYTLYARKRANNIKSICEQMNVKFIETEDYLLRPMSEYKKANGEIYLKFTPFYNAMLNSQEEIKPKTYELNFDNSIKDKNKVKLSELKEYFSNNKHINVNGGRKNGIKLLQKVKYLKEYEESRNEIYNEEGTTNLSSYIRFGCISIREVYEKFKKTSEFLLRQLYWHDFYYVIGYNIPHVFGNSMKENLKNIEWNNNKKLFNKWCQGETGFPIIDAAMRQLNTTGYMHNRCRMIVADFLIKILGCDWRWGEKYFATQLIDYDPCVNNGSWQFHAGTGVDSQPYFRIFNPWRQSKKFDKECEYIKRWVPELETVNNKDIHNWDTKHVEYDVYQEPIVEDIKINIKDTIKRYAKAYRS